MFDIVLNEITLLIPLIPQFLGLIVVFDLIRSILFNSRW